jgi:hypothetical protein
MNHTFGYPTVVPLPRRPIDWMPGTPGPGGAPAASTSGTALWGAASGHVQATGSTGPQAD